MEQSKPWWQSTGIVGPLVMLIAWGLKKGVGIDLGPADIQPIVDNIFLVIGAVLGAYGRVTATKRIGS